MENRNTNEAAPEFLTHKEAREVARCSSVTLWRERKNGLPYHRIGSKLLFRRDELLAHLSRNQAGESQ